MYVCLCVCVTPSSHIFMAPLATAYLPTYLALLVSLISNLYCIVSTFKYLQVHKLLTSETNLLRHLLVYIKMFNDAITMNEIYVRKWRL